jgi:adenylate kinase
MKIVITGTPGTGKTIVADILGKSLKKRVVHINDFAKKKKLIIGKTRGSYVVDLKKLRKKLLDVDGILESHLLCEFGLPGSIVFVLRCDPKVLAHRLQKRKYLRKKIKENLEVEALDYCTINAEKNYRRVYDIDTTKRAVNQVVKKIIAVLKKKGKADKVDFSNYFMR